MAPFPIWLAFLAILTVSITAVAEEPGPKPALDRHGDPLPPGAIARLGTARFRGADWITHLAFSPDGKRLVTQSYQKISIWDAASGQKQSEFAGQAVGPLAWRADGHGVMLVYHENGQHRIGDFTREALNEPPATPRVEMKADAVGKGPLADDEQISGYAISPDGRRLVAGRKGNRERARAITVFEIEPGKSISELRTLYQLGPQLGNCHQIVFSPDSKFVGIVTGIGPINVFNPNRPQTSTMSFVLYDLATGKEHHQRTIPIPRSNGGRWTMAIAWTMALAPEGRFLAVGGNNNVCHVYELRAGGAEVSFGEPKKARPYSSWAAVAFAGNRIFAAGADDDSLHFHDVKTGLRVRPAVKTTDSIEAMALSPDGKRMATSGQAGITRLWDVDTCQESEPVVGHQGSIWQVQVTADGARALTSGYDGIPRLWELKTGKMLRRFDLPDISESFHITPDDKGLLVMTGAKVSAFDLATGTAIPLPPAMALATEGALFHSGNSRSVLIGDAASVSIWDWPDGRLLRKIDFRDIEESLLNRKSWEASLAPDGKILVVRGRTSVGVWDAATGAFRARLQESVAIDGRGFAFLDHGRYLARLGRHSLPNGVNRAEATRLSVWDLRSGKLVRKFALPDSSLSHAVAADPRGYILASAEEGDAGFTLLYEVATGEIRRRLPGHANTNSSIAFTPDGDRLVTVGGDSTGLVWDVSLNAAARRKKPGSAADLDRAWDTLVKRDAKAAYDALLTFISNPQRAVEIARQRMRPAVLDAAALDRLVADLDSDKFAIRDRATKDLEKLDRTAVSRLRSVAMKEISLELKRRLTNFLDRFDDGELLPEELRALRSLEFLEGIGTPAAREVIFEMTKGEPSADLTSRAIAAMGRLDRRKN